MLLAFAIMFCVIWLSCMVLGLSFGFLGMVFERKKKRTITDIYLASLAKKKQQDRLNKLHRGPWNKD